MREQLRLVLEILDNASYTDDVGKRLYAVAAEFGRLAGFLAYDTNQHALAQRYCIAASRAAHVADDRALGAAILAEMSQQARYRNPRDALRLAESGLIGAKELTPAVAARRHSRIAAAAASSGDAATADRARDRMFELTAEIELAAEPPWMYWWSDAEAHYRAGQAALALNNARRAESHFRDAVVRANPTYPRDEGRWLPALAMARLVWASWTVPAGRPPRPAPSPASSASERIRTRLVGFPPRRRTTRQHHSGQGLRRQVRRPLRT